MRAFVLVCSFAFFCVVSGDIDIEAINAECMEKTKLSKEALETIFDKNFLMGEQHNDYVECVAEKVGSCTDGRFNFVKVEEGFRTTVFPLFKTDALYNAVKANECLEKCKDVKGTGCGELSGVFCERPLVPGEMECVEKTKMNLVDVLNVLDEKYLIVEENDSLIYGYIKCMTELYGVCSEKELFLENFTKAIIGVVVPMFDLKLNNPEEQIREYVKNCENLKSEDCTKSATKMYNCVIKSIGE